MNRSLKLSPFGTLSLILILGLISGILGVSGYLKGNNALGQAMNLFILMLTMMAVAIYTYFQFLQVKKFYALVVNFAMQQSPNDPYHILTFFRNATDYSIQVWAELKANVYGQVVNIGGFYSTEHPWPLHPQTVGQGHFSILDDVLTKAGYTIEKMKKTALEHPEDAKKLLRFSARIWYEALDIEQKAELPLQNYYFDFSRGVLVLDV